MHIVRMVGISLGLNRRGYSWAYITPKGEILSGEHRYDFDRSVGASYMRCGFSRRDAYFGMRHDQFASFIEDFLPKRKGYTVSYDIPYSLTESHVCTEYGAQIGFLQLYCYRKKIPLTGIQRLDLHSRMTGLQRPKVPDLIKRINAKGHSAVSDSEARAIGLVYYANPCFWLSKGRTHDYTKLGFGNTNWMGDQKTR